jgi:hypothetical protein
MDWFLCFIAVASFLAASGFAFLYHRMHNYANGLIETYNRLVDQYEKATGVKLHKLNKF